MALKEIANDDMVLEPSDSSVECLITRTGSPSATTKAGDAAPLKGVITHGFGISVSGIVVPTAGATIPDPVTYNVTLISTAQFDKADNSLVCLNGDKTAVINATPQIPPVPPAVDPTDYPISFTIDITNPGQTKVKGE